MTYFKFRGWEPDTEPTVEGVITDCQNLVPTLGGFKAGGSLVSSGLSALAAACQGAIVTFKLDDTTRLFAGTQTHLYEDVGGAWTDQTRAAGVYTGNVDTRWRFVQFGNVTIATNYADAMQFSNGSGVFADIGGNCPKASIIETAANFVLAFDTSEVTDGALGDRWACSALGDYTRWAAIPPTTGDAAAQAAFGRLLTSPGRIKAARKFGDDIVVYKERSAYLGRYVGPPFVWAFTLLPGEIGAPCQEAVVTVSMGSGLAQFFVGPDDFYMFDGTVIRNLPNPLRKWFFANLNATYRYRIWGYHDRRAANVYWYFPSSGSSNGALDSAIVYNYRENKWSRADKTIEAVLDYIGAGLTWDQLGTAYATWNDLPAIPYDSPFWTPAAFLSGVFDTSHTLNTLTGSGAPCMIATHEMGDDEMFSTVDRFRPRLIQAPSSATCALYGKQNTGDSFVQSASNSLQSGRFDVMNSARWHKGVMNFTGSMEINGFSVNATPDGSE